MNNLLTIQEAGKLAGITQNTVYKYIRLKKIKGKKLTKNGKSNLYVSKQDLERFLGYEIIQNNPIDNPNVSIDNPEIIQNNPDIEGIIKSTVERILSNYQQTLMKPLNEQSMFIAGKLTQENAFLKQRLETVLKENEELQDKMKAIPDLQKEKEKVLTEIQDLHKQEIDLLKTEAQKQREKIEAHLLQEKEEEKVKLLKQAEKEKTELETRLTIKAMEETAKIKAEAEEEKKQISDAWKKEMEEAKRPWWKFW